MKKKINVNCEENIRDLENISVRTIDVLEEKKKKQQLYLSKASLNSDMTEEKRDIPRNILVTFQTG